MFYVGVLGLSTPLTTEGALRESEIEPLQRERQVSAHIKSFMHIPTQKNITHAHRITIVKKCAQVYVHDGWVWVKDSQRIGNKTKRNWTRGYVTCFLRSMSFGDSFQFRICIKSLASCPRNDEVKKQSIFFWDFPMQIEGFIWKPDGITTKRQLSFPWHPLSPWKCRGKTVLPRFWSTRKWLRSISRNFTEFHAGNLLFTPFHGNSRDFTLTPVDPKLVFTHSVQLSQPPLRQQTFWIPSPNLHTCGFCSKPRGEVETNRFLQSSWYGVEVDRVVHNSHMCAYTCIHMHTEHQTLAWGFKMDILGRCHE